MKLGEMLVRDGRITEDQLAEAIAVQARDGGRLGSVLVELGFLDAEALTIYLGHELGIPIANGATLERCKRSAVRLLTPEQAARYRCIPVVIQGQTLIVAIDDPHDMMALDHLSAITGYRVIPRVASEIRIYYYLERFYGVRRPPRFRKLGDAPRGSKASKPEHRDLPAPPLPGLPPKRQTPTQAPTPAPVVKTMEESAAESQAKASARAQAEGSDEHVPAIDRRKKRSKPPPPPPVSPDHEAIELDAADLVGALDADETEAATPAESVAAIKRGRPRRNTVEPAVYEPLGRDEAIALMDEAQQRGAVADAVLRYAAGKFEVGALLLVRDNMAFGWKGFGPNLDRDRIETLLMPLEVPSIFHVALHSDYLFRGRAFPASIHNHLFKVLRCVPANYSVVSVVSIGSRVVNMLYAHKADGEEMTEDEANELREVTRAAAESYVRLITVSKKKKSAAGSD